MDYVFVAIEHRELLGLSFSSGTMVARCLVAARGYFAFLEIDNQPLLLPVNLLRQLQSVAWTLIVQHGGENRLNVTELKKLLLSQWLDIVSNDSATYDLVHKRTHLCPRLGRLSEHHLVQCAPEHLVYVLRQSCVHEFRDGVPHDPWTLTVEKQRLPGKTEDWFLPSPKRTSSSSVPAAQRLTQLTDAGSTLSGLQDLCGVSNPPN